MAKILVVDDEELMRELASETLMRAGHEIFKAKEGAEGLDQLEKVQPDLIVSDFKMPGMTGLEFLKEVQKRAPGQAFIIMTAYGTINTAVEAMRSGASNFIEKPFQPEMLEIAVEKALQNLDVKRENENLKAQLKSKYEFIGQSPVWKGIDETIHSVADSNATILVTGESGVGKEVIARTLHARSDRSLGPFIKINCAALPENLIESELFGHEKGAFTGAIRNKKGKFELANDGTLLLDEIGEMPLMAQSKLLRVLQEREVTRIGSDEEIPVNVRVICTTNRDLQSEVKYGNFREDLFYRLNVIPMEIHSLRARREDIGPLVQHFITKFNNEYGYSVEGIEEIALTKLKNYDWPGNIRQLENCMERAMVFTRTGMLADNQFPLGEVFVSSEEIEDSTGLEAGMTIAQVEKILILKTLDECEGNKTKAAQMLDISIRTLRNKLHEYDAFEYDRKPKGDEE